MRKFIFIGLFLLVQPAEAQWPFELWYSGKIVLEGGEILEGLLKYDLQQDLVQYAVGEKIEGVYSARKVMSFEFWVEQEGMYRRFYTLPFTTVGNYKAPVFFELIAEGKMTVMAREAVETKTYSSPYYYGSFTRQELVYHFYFLEENGNLVEFSGKSNELFEMMGKYEKEVERHTRKYKLKLENRLDFKNIVEYYNDFFR